MENYPKTLISQIKKMTLPKDHTLFIPPLESTLESPMGEFCLNAAITTFFIFLFEINEDATIIENDLNIHLRSELQRTIINSLFYILLHLQKHPKTSQSELSLLRKLRGLFYCTYISNFSENLSSINTSNFEQNYSLLSQNFGQISNHIQSLIKFEESPKVVEVLSKMSKDIEAYSMHLHT
jgi:hypothetical protein